MNSNKMRPSAPSMQSKTHNGRPKIKKWAPAAAAPNAAPNAAIALTLGGAYETDSAIHRPIWILISMPHAALGMSLQ